MDSERSGYWENLSMYLSNVSGDAIIEVQKKINSQEGQFVVATQPIPLTDSNGCTLRHKSTKDGKEIETIMYDAFIYYKKAPMANKQINKETGHIEEKPKTKLFVG